MTVRQRVAATLVAVTAILVLASGCTSQPFACPATLPGGPLTNGQPIKVLTVIDDSGRPATVEQIQNPGMGDEFACETDANGNNVGDETEVEIAEAALNAQGYDD